VVAFVAATINVDVPPALTEVGFAAIVTVGAGGGVPATTVTVVTADAFPPVPVAFAV
jgi:hypothetical protein